jgi:signal peptidase I
VVSSIVKILTYIVFGLFLNSCDVENKEHKEHKGQKNTINNSCITKDIYLRVSGKSLSPVVQEGEKLRTLFGFYDCNIIQTGDFVLYRFGKKISYVKFIVGKYNDRFNLIKNQNGKYNITINNKVLTNLNNIAYELSERKTKMLRLDLKQTGGIIPRGKFFIMGNLVEGTYDSTHYGLVNRSGILAKVIVSKKIKE